MEKRIATIYVRIGLSVKSGKIDGDQKLSEIEETLRQYAQDEVRQAIQDHVDRRGRQSLAYGLSIHEAAVVTGIDVSGR